MKNYSYLIIIVLLFFKEAYSQGGSSYDILTCQKDLNKQQKNRCQDNLQCYEKSHQCRYRLRSKFVHKEECKYMKENIYMAIQGEELQKLKIHPTPNTIKESILGTFEFQSEEGRLIYEDYIKEYENLYFQFQNKDGISEDELNISLHLRRYKSWLYLMSVQMKFKEEFMENYINCYQNCIGYYTEEEDQHLNYLYYQYIQCFKKQFGEEQIDEIFGNSYEGGEEIPENPKRNEDEKDKQNQKQLVDQQEEIPSFLQDNNYTIMHFDIQFWVFLIFSLYMV